MSTLWCLQKGYSGGSPRAPSSANNSVPELDLTVSDGSSKRGEVASSTFSGACCEPLGFLASAEGGRRCCQPRLCCGQQSAPGLEQQRRPLAGSPSVLLCSEELCCCVMEAECRLSRWELGLCVRGSQIRVS